MWFLPQMTCCPAGEIRPLTKFVISNILLLSHVGHLQRQFKDVSSGFLAGTENPPVILFIVFY